MSKAQANIIIALLILVFGAAALDTFFTFRRESPAEWEYKIESFEDRSFDTSLNMLGTMGWELTSARRAVTGEGASQRGVYECIFKRVKRDGPPK